MLVEAHLACNQLFHTIGCHLTSKHRGRVGQVLSLLFELIQTTVAFSQAPLIDFGLLLQHILVRGRSQNQFRVATFVTIVTIMDLFTQRLNLAVNLHVSYLVLLAMLIQSRLLVLLLGSLCLLPDSLVGLEVNEDERDVVPAVVVGAAVISYPLSRFLETDSLKSTVMDLFGKLIL